MLARSIRPANEGSSRSTEALPHDSGLSRWADARPARANGVHDGMLSGGCGERYSNRITDDLSCRREVRNDQMLDATGMLRRVLAVFCDDGRPAVAQQPEPA